MMNSVLVPISEKYEMKQTKIQGYTIIRIETVKK